MFLCTGIMVFRQLKLTALWCASVLGQFSQRGWNTSRKPSRLSGEHADKFLVVVNYSRRLLKYGELPKYYLLEFLRYWISGGNFYE